MINILVVDDEAKLNKIICKYLEDHGYHAVACLSANEAFDRMVDVKIDLIVSDIMMPEMDGFKFASLVRRMELF